MKSLILIIFCFLQILVSAQDVEITEENSGSDINLYAVNNSADELDLTFKLELSGCTTNEILPVKKELKPKSRVLLLTINTKSGIECVYNSSVSYQKLRSKDATGQATPGKQRMTGIQINTTKLNIFTRDGCGRCEFAINYLDKNKVIYNELNTTIHLPNNDLMFEMLQKAGFKGNTVEMPVIIYNGVTHYNIKDLSNFLKSIK
jgi:glutaredoxin